MALPWKSRAHRLAAANHRLQWCANTVDPLGGSHAIGLDRPHGRGLPRLQRIDDLGGTLSHRERLPTARDRRSAHRYQRRSTPERIPVGVTRLHGQRGPIAIPLHTITRERTALGSAARYGANATPPHRRRAKNTGNTARDSRANLMRAIAEERSRLRHLGEMCNVLRGVFGE
jgi:methylmalonyl-CoA mutase N-terminal domain/subunit